MRAPLPGGARLRVLPSIVTGKVTRGRARPDGVLRQLLRDLCRMLVALMLVLVALAAARLVVLAAASAAKAGVAWVKDALTPDPVPMPGPRGPRTLDKPLRIRLAVDISDSMTRQDPDARRMTDTKLLLDWASHRVARDGDTVSLAYFDSGLHVAATGPLAQAGSLPVGSPGGNGTAFAPVASWASTAASRDAYDVAVVVTDGDAEDAANSAKELAADMDRVILVQIARDDASSLVQAWTGLDRVHVLQATTRRPQAVAAAIAEQLLEVTGQGVATTGARR